MHPVKLRWRLQSAEAVLKLRSLRFSGDFEAYWQFHKQQELERHHLSRYAECLFLEDFRVEDSQPRIASLQKSRTRRTLT
jgi:hypothetical protein